jgi:uncharacterized coiled-coil protein SlyX
MEFEGSTRLEIPNGMFSRKLAKNAICVGQGMPSGGSGQYTGRILLCDNRQNRGLTPNLRAGSRAVNDRARLEVLEFKCAHLERAIQELSDVLYQQSQRLDEVVLRNQQLRQQLESMESRAAESASGVEIPPHY